MDNSAILASLSLILPYLSKAGEIFKDEASKAFSARAGEALFDTIKSRFTSDKEKEVLGKIEKGDNSVHLLEIFQVLLDSKTQDNEAFKNSLSDVVESHKKILTEVLNHVTNEYNSNITGGLGNDVVNSQGSVHINKTIIQHFHGSYDENASFDVSINTSKFSKQISDENLAQQIENKLFLISIYIKESRYDDSLSLCEELIQLHSQIPDVWEYKAICTYLNTDKRNIIKESAKSILVYLQAALTLRDNKRENNHLQIANEISIRYYKTLKYKIENIISDPKGIKNRDLFKFISEFQTCYKINPDVKFLKEYIAFLSGNRGFTWLYIDENHENQKTIIIKSNDRELTIIDENPSSNTIENLINSAYYEIVQQDKKYHLPVLQFFSKKFDLTLNANQYFTLVEDNSSRLLIKKTDLINQLIQAEELLSVYERELSWEKKKWFGNPVPVQYKVDQMSQTVVKLKMELNEFDEM